MSKSFAQVVMEGQEKARRTKLGSCVYPSFAVSNPALLVSFFPSCRLPAVQMWVFQMVQMLLPGGPSALLLSCEQQANIESALTVHPQQCIMGAFQSSQPLGIQPTNQIRDNATTSTHLTAESLSAHFTQVLTVHGAAIRRPVDVWPNSERRGEEGGGEERRGGEGRGEERRGEERRGEERRGEERRGEERRGEERRGEVYKLISRSPPAEQWQTVFGGFLLYIHTRLYVSYCGFGTLHNWVPCRKIEGPKTLQELHQEVKQAEEREQLQFKNRQTTMHWRGGGRSADRGQSFKVKDIPGKVNQDSSRDCDRERKQRCNLGSSSCRVSAKFQNTLNDRQRSSDGFVRALMRAVCQSVIADCGVRTYELLQRIDIEREERRERERERGEERRGEERKGEERRGGEEIIGEEKRGEERREEERTRPS
ncbi:hypothetical protein D4764_13G0002480 [Takifugu flavidus]|uniref:Uncharacterized protein n=1 Tax=Takifugu flavidus TaxID=433684 RepID=A0A5C6P8R4_9TELE|nr:hypothetical protein D4764_13G0002480 [Takifugu flavidus]